MGELQWQDTPTWRITSRIYPASLSCSTPPRTKSTMGMSREQKMTIDSIKNTLNHFSGAVWWHDGKADDNCKFHGLHIHAIFGCEKELSKTYHFRTFRNRLNISGKIPGSDSTPIDVKTQHVKFPDSLIRHLNQEPRILLGVNNIYLAARIHKVETSPKTEDNRDIDPGVDFTKDDYMDQLKENTKIVESITS